MQDDDEEPGASATGLFVSVRPCQSLLDILTDNPGPDSRTGNFTEAPSLQILRNCFRTSSLRLTDGVALSDALAEPDPVKVCPLFQQSRTTEGLTKYPASLHTVFGFGAWIAPTCT